MPKFYAAICGSKFCRALSQNECDLSARNLKTPTDSQYFMRI